MSAGEARCPLGFTGTPPIGHPSIHGKAAAGGSNAGDSTGKSSTTSSFGSILADYKPSTLLIVDAIFLGLCIIAAIYRDDLKAILSKYITYSPSSSKAPSAGIKQ